MAARYIGTVLPVQTFRERVTSRRVYILLVAYSVAMGVAAVAQLIVGSFGAKSPPTWLFAAFAVISAALASTHRRLETVIDGNGVSVSYGGLERRIAWSDVELVERAARATLVFGHGANVGLYRGRMALAFKIMGAPLVAVVPRGGSGRAMLFSSRQPDEVVSVARSYLEA